MGQGSDKRPARRGGRGAVAVATAIAALALGAAPAAAADWLQYGFGPAHDGFNALETTIGAGNVAGLHRVWQTPQLFDEQQSQPIVAGGKLFVNTGDDGSLNLNVFNATTGRFLWAADTGQYSTATPAVAGGYVYVSDSLSGGLDVYRTSGCGSTACLNPVWRSREAGGASGGASAVVAGGVVYATVGDGRLVAWPAAGCGKALCSGLWSARVHSVAATPAVANGRLYVATDRLRVFDAAGCAASPCAPLWTAPLPYSGWQIPVVTAGRVVVAGGSTVSIFDAAGCGAATCAPLWSGPAGGPVGTAAVANRGVFYIGTGDILDDTGRGVAAFSLAGCGKATCAPSWKGTVPRAVYGSLALANGLLYAPTMDGKLRAFRAGGCGAATCAPSATVAVGAGGNSDNPTVVNGTVYAGTIDGHVVALRP